MVWDESDSKSFFEVLFWGSDLAMRVGLFVVVVVFFGGNLFFVTAGVFWLLYGLLRSFREYRSLDALRQAFTRKK